MNVIRNDGVRKFNIYNSCISKPSNLYFRKSTTITYNFTRPKLKFILFLQFILQCIF